MAAPSSRTRRQNIPFSVIVLIVFLGGLFVLVVLIALNYGHRPPLRAQDAMEIQEFDCAVKSFKDRFGEYPPDFGEQTNEQRVATVKKFLSKAFPKCAESNYPVEFRDPANFDPAKYNPATALVFWLGGMRNADGKPIGFSADPQAPFDQNVKGRIGPFFDFDSPRLDFNVGTRYYPPSYQGDRSQGCYIYFRAENGSYAGKAYAAAGNSGAVQDARLSTGKKIEYMNPNSFQIRSFGPDGRWGAMRRTRWGVMFPTGSDYNPENYDDMGNFSTGMFKDSIP